MEIELKLRFSPENLDALKADPLLGKTAGFRTSRKRLDNIYFDTPDRALASARIGLRLRKDGKKWLQTVKSGGSAQAGLHMREEIEFKVAGRALEWAQLKDTPFESVIEPLKAQLQPQFRTRFTRDIRRLNGASGSPSGGEVELAIDVGEIIAGTRREPLCELELELKSGPVDALFDIALELASRHPLVLDNRSKAERGDALSRTLSAAAPAKAAGISLPVDADAQAAARLAVENCLAQWQANEPGFLAGMPTGYDSEYLHQLRVAIRRLRVACDPLARLARWQVDVMAEIKKPLQKLGQQLGAARDWDMFAQETAPVLLDALDDAAVRVALQDEINLQRSLAHLEARTALAGRETQRLLLLVSRCLNNAAVGSAGDGKSGSTFDDLHSQMDDYRSKLAQGLQNMHHLKPGQLHALRIIAKKLRYLTEFTASRYDAEAVEKWLKWLKKTQDVLGARNDRTTAIARIDRLCTALAKRHGKVKRILHAALETQVLPELNLPPLPDAYWQCVSRNPIASVTF